MKKKQKPEVRALGIAAVSFGVVFLAALWGYAMEPDSAGLISTLFLGAMALGLGAAFAIAGRNSHHNKTRQQR